MSEEDLIRRLNALAQQADAHRSATERLRRVYPQVELALGSGISQRAVLAELNFGDDGFGMTMTSFKSALLRIRKDLKEVEQDSNGDDKKSVQDRVVKRLGDSVRRARDAAGLTRDAEIENPKTLIAGLGAMFSAGMIAKEKAKREVAAQSKPSEPGSE
jgi:hypothetical protein